MKLLVYFSDGYWLARSLEHDWIGTGDEPTFAIAGWRKGKLFREYLSWRYAVPDWTQLPAAPTWYWVQFETAEMFLANSDLTIVYQEQVFQSLSSELEIRIKK